MDGNSPLSLTMFPLDRMVSYRTYSSARDMTPRSNHSRDTPWFPRDDSTDQGIWRQMRAHFRTYRATHRSLRDLDRRCYESTVAKYPSDWGDMTEKLKSERKSERMDVHAKHLARESGVDGEKVRRELSRGNTLARQLERLMIPHIDHTNASVLIDRFLLRDEMETLPSPETLIETLYSKIETLCSKTSATSSQHQVRGDVTRLTDWAIALTEKHSPEDGLRRPELITRHQPFGSLGYGGVSDDEPPAGVRVHRRKASRGNICLVFFGWGG